MLHWGPFETRCKGCTTLVLAKVCTLAFQNCWIGDYAMNRLHGCVVYIVVSLCHLCVSVILILVLVTTCKVEQIKHVWI